jgi:hypothetical protein
MRGCIRLGARVKDNKSFSSSSLNMSIDSSENKLWMRCLPAEFCRGSIVSRMRGFLVAVIDDDASKFRSIQNIFKYALRLVKFGSNSSKTYSRQEWQ